jgi:hypothetical protein
VQCLKRREADMCDELREQLVVLSASREGSRTGQEQVVAAAAMSGGNGRGQPVTARNESEVDYHRFC